MVENPCSPLLPRARFVENLPPAVSKICGLLGVIDFTLLRFLPDAETDKYCARFVEKKLVTLEETLIFRSYLVWLKSTGEHTSLCTSYFGGVSLATGDDCPSNDQPAKFCALDQALQFSYARDRGRECGSGSVCDGSNDSFAFASGEDHVASGDVTSSVLSFSCIFNELQGLGDCLDDPETLNDRQDGCGPLNGFRDGCGTPNGYHDGWHCLVLPDHLVDVEDTTCSAHVTDGVGTEKLVTNVPDDGVFDDSFTKVCKSVTKDVDERFSTYLSTSGGFDPTFVPSDDEIKDVFYQNWYRLYVFWFSSNCFSIVDDVYEAVDWTTELFFKRRKTYSTIAEAPLPFRLFSFRGEGMLSCRLSLATQCIVILSTARLK